MKRILPLLVLCLLLTGCMALPATAPAEPMYLALTFDDGPSPQYTPRLLDGLKQRGVHATFFLIGQQVQDYPELVQRIRAEGHQIGNHTYDHAPLDRLSCGEAMADLSRCDGVLQELAGEGTYWVRPPYGFITEEELAAWSTPMLYWSVDTCDWECRDVQKVFAAICQARDGDVILLHDCYGTSVEAALQAIDCLSEQGVEFVTVEELFALRGQTAEAAHNLQVSWLPWINLNFFSDMPDMHCHCIICSNCFLIPDVFVDLINGKYPSLILHQKKQDIVLNRCQLYHITVYPDFLQIIVYTQTSCLVDMSILHRYCCSQPCISAKL